MPHNRRQTLEQLTQMPSAPAARCIASVGHRLPFAALNAANRLRGGAVSFFGRNVLIRTQGQFATILAALALDGIARRMLLCPPDIPEGQIPHLMQDGEVERILSDADIDMHGVASPLPASTALPNFDTEWVLLTSGTSGVPKLVLHSLASLMAPLHNKPAAENPVWSTFYDIRRYGGLQILLRALTGGGSLVLSEAGEPVAAFLTRLGNAGATHVSGTPSHWRRALMSGASSKMAPAYIRLSGETAGQDILDHLRITYPQAKIGHVFASTEAGVALSVDDGAAGFPVAALYAVPPHPNLRIENGTLRVRSNAMASRYLGQPARPLTDAHGFIDTGDMVVYRNDRYVFMGRREGVVNIGGQKVYPEEVEAAINRHPGVAMSRVWGRPSPITGTLIAADIVLTSTPDGEPPDFPRIRDEILTACRSTLAPHKVPVRLTAVAQIPVTISGKIERRHA
jgi:acyl-coenzyme A synthetase/AMP-(fatty) acid ligase